MREIPAQFTGNYDMASGSNLPPGPGIGPDQGSAIRSNADFAVHGYPGISSHKRPSSSRPAFFLPTRTPSSS